MKLNISAVFCTLFAALLCVYILTTSSAEWLTVETPSYAVPGGNFIVKVELKNPEPGLRLGVDLHHLNKNKESLGCLSVSRSVEITDNKNSYEFYIPVPAKRELTFIFPVVILSRDGSWSGRVKSAESEPVPIQLSEKVPDRIILTQMKTHDTGEKVFQFIPESDTLRFMTAVLWGVLAVMLLFKRNIHHSAVLALNAAVSAVWEWVGISTAIAIYLRGVALHTGSYGLRREPQQILTIIIILACTAVILYLFSVLHKPHITIILICLAIFWSISLLSILSLHEIDRILTLTIAGIQTGQLLRLASAALAAATFLYFIINERGEI